MSVRTIHYFYQDDAQITIQQVTKFCFKILDIGLSFLENMFSLLFNANPEDNEDIDEEDNDGELEENPDKSEPKSNQVRAT